MSAPYLVPNTFDLQRLLDSNGKFVVDSANKAVWVQNPSPSVPTNNSVGVLADAISCTTKHELNGQDELVMEYPITGDLFDEIQLRAVIVASVEQRGNQPYRIYRITKPLNGIITVYARHLVYDLAGIVVEPYTANGIQAALAGLNSHAMVNNPFTFSTGRTTASVFTVKVPTPIWSLMGGQQGSLLDVYGGEYSWDGYNISLFNHIGSNNGVSVRYGVNMTDLEQDAACDACYTGVVGYWQNEDTVVHSPVVSAIGTYGYVRILTVDFSDKFESAPTVDQLSAAAAAYIEANQIGVPKVSWKVNWVPLDTTEEYKDIACLERAALGDTIGVKFEKLGVNATARVNSIEWDVLLDRYITINLGSVRNNIADTIAGQTLAIEQTPTREEVKSLSSIIAAGIMGAHGGSVRFLDTDNDGEPDTLYIADNPDPTLAQKVWRFNYEGWAASSTGYDGEFVMGATLDGGLIADFITAGTLSANRVRGGTFKVGGYDNESGRILFYDENGQYYGKINAEGLLLENMTDTAAWLTKDAIRMYNYDNGSYKMITRLGRAVQSFGNHQPYGTMQLYTVYNNNYYASVALQGDGASSIFGNLTIAPPPSGYPLQGSGTLVAKKVECDELWVNGRQIT